MPSSATAVVETTDLQKSVFGTLPSSAAAIANLPPIPPAPASLKVPQPAVDTTMEDAKSPATSVAGQKRRRDDEDDVVPDDEDSDEDVAMEEDSDEDE